MNRMGKLLTLPYNIFFIINIFLTEETHTHVNCSRAMLISGRGYKNCHKIQRFDCIECIALHYITSHYITDIHNTFNSTLHQIALDDIGNCTTLNSGFSNAVLCTSTFCISTLHYIPSHYIASMKYITRSSLHCIRLH